MRGWRVRAAAVTAALLLLPVVPLVAGSPARAAATCVEPGTVSVPVPWAQSELGFDRVWSLVLGSGITVAVLDSGVNGTHPQMSGHVLPGADFLHGPGTAPGDSDCVGHGTAVASLIAAQPAGNTGFTGVAPGVRILPVTVSEKTGVTDEEQGDAVAPATFATALRWAVDHGANVVNMSVVYYTDYREIRDAVRYAESKDVVLVAAVGNLGDDKNPTPYPAAYDDVIGVGSVDRDGTVAKYSAHGGYVDLVAPGDGITAAVPLRGHAEYDGTSVATPFVAGAAALVRDYWPALNERQVGERLMATASPAAGDPGSPYYGHGMLDPYRAVTERLASAPPLVQPPALASGADPAALAARRDRARLVRWSLLLTSVVAALVLALVVAAAAHRRGRRTGWRPTRAPRPAPRPDETGQVPVGLFEEVPP